MTGGLVFSIGYLALLLNPILATHLPQQWQKRQCLPDVEYKPEISYNACYNDSESPRALDGPMYTISSNSPETCAQTCGRYGYKYAGVEYTIQCFCGNSITAEKAASEGDCSAVCPGDADEKCGGTYRVNIWNIENPLGEPANPYFPDCARDPLCSNDVCDPSLSPKKRAAALLKLWTVEEKLANLVEKAAGVPRLGILPYNWWAEGLHGLASSGVHFNAPGSGKWDAATSFPQPILVGAAFDDDLVRAMAEVISTETRAFNGDGRVGLDLYTPNINSFKDPRWGRGQETPGEDPMHLQSYVRALLSGLEEQVGGYKKTISTCKHFAGNDFESFGSVSRHDFDAQITLQDLNEFYLAPFRVCAERDAGAFMCSYNAVNGHPACANTYLMEDILRKHWGWEKDEHYISTDCGVTEDTWKRHKYVATPGEAAAVVLKSGADLECEFGRTEAIFEAWDKNLITEDDMDKALTRLWAALVSVGWFDAAANQPLRKLGWDDVNTAASQQLAYEAAVMGSVLIKNENHLPLSSEKSVAFIGPWFDVTNELQGNYYGPAPFLISPLKAATDMGLDFKWAKGSAINAQDSSFDDAIQKAKDADEIVFMGGLDNSIEEEGRDRLSLTWPIPQIELVRELSKLGKPVTVVQFGGGQVDDTELLKNEDIKAILWSGYPGQSGGKAVLDLLYGNAAPAGRLPVTQYPADYVNQVPPTDMTLRPLQNGTNPGRTHMWYTGDAPVPFGFGLHYTKFDVKLSSQLKWETSFEPKSAQKVEIEAVKSLQQSTSWMELLNVPVVSVPIEVANTGKVTSDYVALVFLRSNAGPEPRPKQTLVGYTRIKAIEPGSKKSADVALSLERFLRVDEDGSRVLYPGDYEVFVDIDERASAKFQWEGSSLLIEEFPQPE